MTNKTEMQNGIVQESLQAVSEKIGADQSCLRWLGILIKRLQKKPNDIFQVLFSVAKQKHRKSTFQNCCQT